MSGLDGLDKAKAATDSSVASAQKSRVSLSSYAPSTAPLLKEDKDEAPGTQQATSTSRAGSSGPQPASAARVSSIMGPPPPDEKKPPFWKRWQQDRKDAKELNMPERGSSKKWRVGYVTS